MFSAKDSEITDEDIDRVLERGAEVVKTLEDTMKRNCQMNLLPGLMPPLLLQQGTTSLSGVGCEKTLKTARRSRFRGNVNFVIQCHLPQFRCKGLGGFSA